MCEVIMYGNSEFENFNGGWTADDKKNALAHLKALESFDFIYSMVTLFRSLLYVKNAVISLQGPSSDLISGMSKVEECCKELKREREDIEHYSQRIFQHSSRLAEKSHITVSMPRTTHRQQHRLNPQSSSVEDYFKQTVAIPFLDYLISSLTSRFDKHTKQVAALQGLLPCYITSGSSFDDIAPTITFYAEDLPYTDIIDEELHHWKSMWLKVPRENRPKTLSETLKECSPSTLPNIYTLLKLFATLPLSSCSCERSGSTLRRLHTYLRSTQTEERLSALALINANYEMEINIDSVCKLYLEKHPRRIECASLLF